VALSLRAYLHAGAGIALAALAGTAIAQQDPAHRLAYGKHLSQECTTCHRIDGKTTQGIPAITGLDPDYFVTTMKFYQSGARDNQTMVSVAKPLNEEQLQALAAYFHSLKPPAKAKNGKKR
jgi:cytochrome c553